MGDILAWGDHMQDEAAGRNAARSYWEGACTTPFRCSYSDFRCSYSDENENGQVHTAGRGPGACLASTASAAAPVRRHVSEPPREFLTMAECQQENEWEQEEWNRLNEEAGGDGRWVDDGRFSASGKHFLCENCFRTRDEDFRTRDEERAAEEAVVKAQRSAAQKRKRGEKDAAAKKRLNSTMGVESETLLKLSKLKAPELKKLCRANKCPVSGSRGLLLNRLHAFLTHGRIESCPRCLGDMARNARFGASNSSKLELVFADGHPEEPIWIKCSHMKGMGRRCGFQQEINSATKASVLNVQGLADCDGLLACVGL